jgi:predicted transcriptional regulator
MNKPVLPDTIPDEEREAFLAAVEAGIASADAGRTVPYEKVREWLLSWGKPGELSAPKGSSFFRTTP